MPEICWMPVRQNSEDNWVTKKIDRDDRLENLADHSEMGSIPFDHRIAAHQLANCLDSFPGARPTQRHQTPWTDIERNPDHAFTAPHENNRATNVRRPQPHSGDWNQVDIRKPFIVTPEPFQIPLVRQPLTPGCDHQRAHTPRRHPPHLTLSDAGDSLANQGKHPPAPKPSNIDRRTQIDRVRGPLARYIISAIR